MASGGGSVVVSQAPTQAAAEQQEQPMSARGGVQKVALPLHVQMLQRALNLDRLVNQVQAVLDESQNGVRLNLQSLKASSLSSVAPKISRQLTVPKNQLYNFQNVTPERKWVQELLLSDSEGSGSELSESEQLQIMLELQYKRRKKWRKRLRRDPKLLRYKYFSVGLLLKDDPYPEHAKAIEEKYHTHLDPAREDGLSKIESRQKLWSFIVKKEIPKMAKQFHTARHNVITNNRKIAQLCQREVKKLAAKSQKVSKEASVQPRARRLMKEAMIYWRKYEKVEREQRRKAEKEAMEQRKLDDDMREAKKQQRKLNFLITQTELYAHFMAKKLTGEDDLSDKILEKLDDAPLQREIRPGVVVNLEQPEDYDANAIKAKALSNVQSAFKKHEQSNFTYKELARQGVGESVGDEANTDLQNTFDKSFSLATPVLISDKELPQPTIFKGMLKVYQLKGMNWLANLYDQGINGILADEMGLGKTVQSIAFLAHLAEHQRTWGPFLIVSPASTLHNWQQECTRFVPRFKVLPYWGSPHERKIIRKYWNQKLLYRENAPFHILITSYQLVVQDVKYFQRVKWQYMILDEAQAIKSSSSVRWKVLLSFNCRNRLLLTGTPIQNTMQELWALLHFIMPTMFDSHEEFNEWFSKDIESHAEKKSVLDEHQLSRLHLILKPFMLRRIKKDVEHEMAEKIEVHLSCDLSTRQRKLYDGLRKRISVEDLLQSSAAQAANSTRDSATSHLLNLVMQFRKVCNHPDLFERRNVTSPISVPISSVSIPTLLYHQVLTPSLSLHRLHTLTLGVHSTAHIHASSREERGCWSFLRLTDSSPQEANTVMLGSLAERFVVLMSLVERVHLVYQQRLWETNLSHSRSSRSQLLLWPSFTLSHPAQEHSPLLRSLVFTSHTSTAYTHTTHHLYPLGTSTTELSKISSTVSAPTQEEERMDSNDGGAQGLSSNSRSIHQTKAKSLSPNNAHHSHPSIDQHSVALRRQHTQYHCMLTDMPKFLVAYSPKVRVPWIPPYCSHRSAENVRQLCLSGGPPHLKEVILHGCLKREAPLSHHHLDILRSRQLAGLDALKPPNGWSHIQIPDKENMIYDSGKMVVLDKLLAQLKREEHRVLIYSQMTRMIDLLEEFMSCRRYRYIRLDGSSKISDRRDMVADFQTNSEIFAFLLSTRAGGLGINLTAADTVIFFDSDWNPTVDQQAMDRAHRLGQTKQVTVYRLIVKGSIEERILQRAREKSEIQKMVISGGDFKPDTLKAKEMVSLLLDDDEMETRFLAKQAEKKAVQDQQGKKTKNNRKRKTAPNGREGESLLKRPSTGTGLVSNTPSPLMFSTRPDSVISGGSNGEVLNGDDTIDVVGSTDGSEVNSEISRQGGGTTPVRKLPGSRRSNGSGLGVKKRTSAPLGGRGKMQRSSKKGVSGSAAASAGAMAGALAASSAAYAAYAAGYGLSPHQISPSPSNSGGSPGGAVLTSHHGNSVQSSPRVSPVPQAFVATSLITTTPPSGKGTKNTVFSSNPTPKNNV